MCRRCRAAAVSRIENLLVEVFCLVKLAWGIWLERSKKRRIQQCMKRNQHKGKKQPSVQLSSIASSSLPTVTKVKADMESVNCCPGTRTSDCRRRPWNSMVMSHVRLTKVSSLDTKNSLGRSTAIAHTEFQELRLLLHHTRARSPHHPAIDHRQLGFPRIRNSIHAGKVRIDRKRTRLNRHEINFRCQYSVLFRTVGT